MTRTISSRLIAVAICCIATGVLMRAAQNRPGGSVTMDFLVVSADGRPIRDLKPEDITLRMDAKTRTVRSLQFVPVTDAPGTGLTTPVPLPAPYATNVTSQIGRGFVFVIDDESLRVGEERRTKEAITQLLAELPATDRVAIVTIPHGGIKADFTTDRDKIREALAPIVGQSRQEQLLGQEAACQTRLVLETITGTLNSLGGSSPTTFVVLTAGLVGPRSDTIRSGRTVGQCELTPEQFQNVAVAAADARAQFYLIQAEHLLMGRSATNTALFGGDDNPAVGLENLAGVTGTKILALPTTGDNPLIRIARETSAHYLVTFDIEANEYNSNTHKIDIKVARPDATVRVRPMLALNRPNASKANAAKTAADTLKDTNAYRDLPLRTAVFTSRNTGDDKIKIVATIEPIDPAAAVTQVVAGVYDGNKLVARWTSKPEDVANRPVLAALLVPAGNYRLRAAANNAAGQVGVVDTPLAAELTPAGPLKLSSLVLGAAKPGGGFAPRMEFGSEQSAIGYLELYGGKADLQVAGVVEIAESVSGPALQSINIQWGATEEAGKYNGIAQIPLGSLKPGDYIVRAIVGVVGDQEGRVIRTLRKR
jgi:VWFA-related protein